MNQSVGSEIVPTTTTTTAIAHRPSFFDLEPRAQVEKAKEISTVLVEVIREKGLARNLGGAKDHVDWEGWAIMLTFLGVRTETRRVLRHPNGSWEAEVDLVRIADGAVLGRGSALCGVDEPQWGKAKDYARRSMAITRAAGKAARLNFSWIMALGGLNPTPAEEMEVLDLSAPFDATNAEHLKLVRDEANARGLDPTKLKTLKQKMEGKPLQELANVINELTK